jgi:polyhydroxyalkanoate synthesis regulator phasin
MLNAEEARALFEELSASERESEEHGLKENSRTIEIETSQGSSRV